MMEHPLEGDQAKPISAGPAVGSLLREAREKMGLSIMDVAGQIKFAPRQIEALEAGDYKHLPEPAFIRGFVRSYAKILHLDSQPLLDALPQPRSNEPAELSPPAVGVAYPDGHAAQRQNLIWLGAALFLSVVVVGFAVWHFTTPVKHAATSATSASQSSVQQEKLAQVETPVTLPDQTEKQSASPVSKSGSASRAESTPRQVMPPQASVSNLSATVSQTKSKPSKAKQEKPDAVMMMLPHPPATTSTVIPGAPQLKMADTPSLQLKPGPRMELRLVFDVQAWAEIKNYDGKILSSRMHEPGTELRLHGQAPLSLVIANPSSVHLYKNGTPVDLAPYVATPGGLAKLTLE